MSEKGTVKHFQPCKRGKHFTTKKRPDKLEFLEGDFEQSDVDISAYRSRRQQIKEFRDAGVRLQAYRVAQCDLEKELGPDEEIPVDPTRDLDFDLTRAHNLMVCAQAIVKRVQAEQEAIKDQEEASQPPESSGDPGEPSPEASTEGGGK